MLEKRVRPLARQRGRGAVVPCDVTDDAQVEECFRQVGERWDSFDVLIHAVAFAQREDLEGRFMNTSRDGFLKAHGSQRLLAAPAGAPRRAFPGARGRATS
jgi:enoyl-[acyl-carrier protein] reductase I